MEEEAGRVLGHVSMSCIVFFSIMCVTHLHLKKKKNYVYKKNEDTEEAEAPSDGRTDGWMVVLT